MSLSRLCLLAVLAFLLGLMGCSGGDSSNSVIAGVLGPFSGNGTLSNNAGEFSLTYTYTGASGNGQHGVQGKLTTTGPFPGTTDLHGSLDDATGITTMKGQLPGAAPIDYTVTVSNNEATVNAYHELSQTTDTGTAHTGIK